MPVSDIESITPIMREVARLQPKTVLDLGVGVGKYGVLCREVLDGVYGRVRRFDWEAEIFGVEGFAKYANPVWQAYTNVLMNKFQDLPAAFYKDHDLVLMIDSLEHMEEVEGATFLRQLVESNKNVIVSVPLGNHPQGACFGNELETHRTTFPAFQDVRSFDAYKYNILHCGVCLVLSISGVRS